MRNEPVKPARFFGVGQGSEAELAAAQIMMSLQLQFEGTGSGVACDRGHVVTGLCLVRERQSSHPVGHAAAHQSEGLQPAGQGVRIYPAQVDRIGGGEAQDGIALRIGLRIPKPKFIRQKRYRSSRNCPRQKVTAHHSFLPRHRQSNRPN